MFPYYWCSRDYYQIVMDASVAISTARGDRQRRGHVPETDRQCGVLRGNEVRRLNPVLTRRSY